MTDSIWHRGLPDSFFTRRNAYATGITLGLVFVLAASTYVWVKRYVTEPAEAPACYGEAKTYSVRESEVQASNARRPRDGVDEYTRQGTFYADKVRAAHAACQPGACDGKAYEAYRSALFWYMSDRLRHMSRLNVIHGESGIRAAQQTFARSIDREIETGMRQRYRAGVFRLNNISDADQRQAMAVLIFKDATALRPCARPDPAAIRGSGRLSNPAR